MAKNRIKNPDEIKKRSEDKYREYKNGVQVFYDLVKQNVAPGQVKKLLQDEQVQQLVKDFGIEL